MDFRITISMVEEMTKSDFTEIRKGVYVLNEDVSKNLMKLTSGTFKKKTSKKKH